MRAKCLVVGLIGVLAITAGLVRPAAAGSYDDPFYLGWQQYLPPTPIDYLPGADPNASAEDETCLRGQIQCVDNVIREMTKRWRNLGCDHNGTFALTYLVTTIQYRDAVATPGFFSDPAFLNHYDAVFADFYTRARDDWKAGRIDRVPPVWRIAFQAADTGQATGMGDVYLGMMAHIIRDLPLVLYQIGLVDEDGNSRKPDHDQVNVFLNAVNMGVLSRVAGVYDPTIDDGDAQGTTTDNSLTTNLVIEWREEAWRKAELLKSTPKLLQPSVLQMIEDDAATRAMALLQANTADAAARTARDSYCASHFPAKGSAEEQALLTPF